MAYNYNIPPEEIRAQSFTFQALILASFNRLHELIPEVLSRKERGAWQDWRAIELSVRCLDAFLAPYYLEEYDNLVKKNVLPHITNQNLTAGNPEYLFALMHWVKLMVQRFGQVDVLPHIPERYKFKDPIDYEKEGLEKYADAALDRE